MIFAGNQESQESLVVPSGGGGEHAAPDLRTLRTPVSCRSPEPPCRPGTERGHAIGARWASECPPAVSATARSGGIERGVPGRRLVQTPRQQTSALLRRAPSRTGCTSVKRRRDGFNCFCFVRFCRNSQSFTGICRNPPESSVIPREFLVIRRNSC